MDESQFQTLYRPRTNWVRIGIMLHETSEIRPLLGMQASADGGIILSPSKSLPKCRWEYGYLDTPTGSTSGNLGFIRPDGSAVRTDRAPKLHYHRSGYASIDMQGHLPKRSLNFSPMESLRGSQFFGCSVTNPQLVDPTYRHKRGDMFVVAHGNLPALVTVHGFCFGLDQLPFPIYDQVPDDRPGFLVSARRAELITLLTGHGLECAIVIRFSMEDSPWPLDGSNLQCTLFGFDEATVLADGVHSLLGMWTRGNDPKIVRAARPKDRPFTMPDGTPDWTTGLAEMFTRRREGPHEAPEQ